MTGRLKDKVAVITGAGSGIGRASAVLFAREGAEVWVADINEQGGLETVEKASEGGHKARFLSMDVTDPASVEAGISQVVQQSGRLNVLMNNAGGSTTRDRAVTEVPYDEFWRTIKLDLFGTLLCSRFGIPHIAAAGGGSIVNMVSNAALMGILGRDAYTAAKGGVAALTRSMAVEFSPRKIRVNAIAPSATRTERAMGFLKNEAVVKAMVARHLLGIGEPDDVAYAALFFASDESMVTTGQILAVDSGITVS